MEFKRTKKEMTEFLPETKINYGKETVRVDGRDKERVQYELNKPLGRNKKFITR